MPKNRAFYSRFYNLNINFHRHTTHRQCPGPWPSTAPWYMTKKWFSDNTFQREEISDYSVTEYATTFRTNFYFRKILGWDTEPSNRNFEWSKKIIDWSISRVLGWNIGVIRALLPLKHWKHFFSEKLSWSLWASIGYLRCIIVYIKWFRVIDELNESSELFRAYSK